MPDGAQGLSGVEAADRLRQYGRNEIEDTTPSLATRIIHWIATPMSAMFLAAAVLSFAAGNDADSLIIVVLFAMNVGVGAWHEAKADTAIRKLKEHLAVVVKVKRDGQWLRLPSSELVPDDVVELSTGALVPADVRFISARNITVNDSVVTGESLPKQKVAGDEAYSGSFVATGLCTATVTSTGSRTYFGKTLSLIDHARPQSGLERDILSISKFLSIVSLVVMIMLTVVLALSQQSFLGIA
ncbi:MAG: metal-transporting ATPase, partial [Patescibacteria group bacterium]|nr:metal-transporting ATPase [Patescibacteria group bacterium]